MEFIGTATGGRWFPRELLQGTMLSFGVGEDVSFELEAIASGMKVFCYDPTPKSERYMNSLRSDITYFPVGLAKKGGIGEFYFPANVDEVSCSLDNLQHTDRFFYGRMVDLAGAISLASFSRNQEIVIDILKIDIEGAEYEVIEWMEEHAFWPPIFMVEFHENKDRKPYLSLLETIYSQCIESENEHDYLFIK